MSKVKLEGHCISLPTFLRTFLFSGAPWDFSSLNCGSWVFVGLKSFGIAVPHHNITSPILCNCSFFRITILVNTTEKGCTKAHVAVEKMEKNKNKQTKN